MRPNQVARAGNLASLVSRPAFIAIVSADAAFHCCRGMTNRLFHAGHIALTADLRVRFRHPVQVGRPATVRARITRTAGPLFDLAAEVIQDGQVKAKGVGTFFDRNHKGALPCE